MATSTQIESAENPDLTASPSTLAPLKSKDADFRPDIEGLRGIAVLIVVAYHVGIRGFQGGFIGVDVFFVLSGYLITSLLMREVRKTGRISFSNFYARRVRRLLPAAALMIVVIIVLSVFLASPLERFNFSRAARATALYISNLWFTVESVDYFAPEIASNPLLHTWSLAVEEQFYFIWPAIIWFGLCRLRTRRALICTVLVVSLISFAISVAVTHWNAPWAFFGSPARAWEFGLGAIASVCFREEAPDRHRAIWWSIGWLGIAVIVISSVLFSGDTAFPGYLAALPVLGTVCALVAGSSRPGEGIASITNHPVMQHVGKLSYSWYLWHWPALAFLSILVAMPSVWMRLLAVTVALGMAALTKLMIEDPVRYNRWLIARPRLSIAFALLLTISIAGIATFGRARAVQAMNRSDQKLIAEASSVPVVPRKGCLVQYSDPNIQECYGGDERSTQEIVLFGDSKAAQWFPALSLIAQQEGWRLVSHVKASCPAALVNVYNPYLRRTEWECAQWRNAAIARIEALKPMLVIISSDTGYIKSDARHGGFAALTETQWEEGTEHTLSEFESNHIPSLVIRNSPNERISTPVCLSRVAAHTWYPRAACSTNATTALEDGIRNTELRSVGHFPSASYADFSMALCPNGICLPILDGIVVYRDRSHLTFAMSQALAPKLKDQIVLLLAKVAGKVATIGNLPRQAGVRGSAQSMN